MLQNTFTLTGPQTKDIAFRVSKFTDSGAFEAASRHPYFSMLLVEKGAGKLMRDAAEYSFSHGCLVCFALYQPFAIYPDGEFEGVAINFHPAFFCLFKHRNEVSCNGVLFNNLYDTPVVSLNKESLQSMQTITGQMTNEMQREAPDPDVILSYLKIFLIEASRVKLEQRRAETTGPNTYPAILHELKQAVDTHFKTFRVAGNYAQLLHISENALNKTCKLHFGKTITSLIAERMTIEAKRELYLSAKPVKQIAYELGYRDAFYFSRFFKKNVGVSPQMFRDNVGFDKLNP
jgi:AraC family transcriptional activator of pobA